jgi:hypothetical protein
MSTQIVFKFEETDSYGTKFAKDCNVSIKEHQGIVFLENNQSHPIGFYSNLRQEGETLVADIKIFEKMKPIENRFDYSIAGFVVSTNEHKESTEVVVLSVAASMNEKD